MSTTIRVELNDGSNTEQVAERIRLIVTRHGGGNLSYEVDRQCPTIDPSEPVPQPDLVPSGWEMTALKTDETICKPFRFENRAGHHADRKLPDAYLPASIRNWTPVASGLVGLAFTMPEGQVLRVGVPVEQVHALAETFCEAARTAYIPRAILNEQIDDDQSNLPAS